MALEKILSNEPHVKYVKSQKVRTNVDQPRSQHVVPDKPVIRPEDAPIIALDVFKDYGRKSPENAYATMKQDGDHLELTFAYVSYALSHPNELFEKVPSVQEREKITRFLTRLNEAYQRDIA